MSAHPTQSPPLDGEPTVDAPVRSPAASDPGTRHTTVSPEPAPAAARPSAPPGYAPRTDGHIPRPEWVDVPAGGATLGVDRGSIPFGWDNEFPAHAEDVPAFSIDRHDVTNAAFLEFVDAGGYSDGQWWRPADWACATVTDASGNSSGVEHDLANPATACRFTAKNAPLRPVCARCVHFPHGADALD